MVTPSRLAQVSRLGVFGIDLERLTDGLERDGIEQFARSVESVVELIDSYNRPARAA
jgi:hypothetical protein